jgi:hypothetical protein
MIDMEDDWSDEACIQTHAGSFSIHEACFDILLECRRYQGVGIKDKGKEFDQFINDLGSTLTAFDDKQSTRGCRLVTPWYARQDDFDIIQEKPEPMVRIRAGGKWSEDKENRFFQDPKTTMTLTSTSIGADTKSKTSIQKRRSYGPDADVFSRLPEELRTELLTWLPSEDVVALRRASRAIRNVPYSAAFWYSRLNAPELQMALVDNVKSICAETDDKKGVLCGILRLGFSRTRIARMANEALWYVQVCSTIRKHGVDKPRRLRGSPRPPEQKVHSGLQAGRLPFAPEWYSAVQFDRGTPFSAFKTLMMFFHTPRRYLHCSPPSFGEIEHDRQLIGIRFENGTQSKDLGHCQSRDTIQVRIPESENFDGMTLRIDTNNTVSVESVYSTNGNVRFKRDVYWSSLSRPFRARFEEISFSDLQEIKMGLTRECRVVVFDILVADAISVDAPKRKRRRLR